jgi:lipid-A-disaccharide synthase
VRPVVACAGPALRPLVDEAVRASGLEVEVLDGGVGPLHGAARAAVCVSGTVTVECLHALVPAVVTYQLSAARREAAPWVLTVPWFTLANLLARWEVYPEHFDPAGEAGDVARELEWLLADGPGRDRVVASLRSVRDRLAAPGCHDRVAAVVEAHLPPG